MRRYSTRNNSVLESLEESRIRRIVRDVLNENEENDDYYQYYDPEKHGGKSVLRYIYEELVNLSNLARKQALGEEKPVQEYMQMLSYDIRNIAEEYKPDAAMESRLGARYNRYKH